MDIALQSLDYFADDKSWLGSDHGVDDAETITLDMSTFTLATYAPNGFVTSGIVVGKISASGLYGPYAGSVSEVQRIAVDATGGTFTISFDGATTAAIAATATAAAVQTALLLLPTVNPGDIVVTGGPGAAGGATPYILTFGARYLGQDVPAVTTAAGSLTGGAGTAAVTTTTAGGSGSATGLQTPVGLILSNVPVHRDSTLATVNTTNLGAAMFTHGTVRTARLPAASGLDAFAQAALNRIRFI